MRSKGTHTWDLYLFYHQCPSCGYIIENQEDFVEAEGKRVKELDCPRCSCHFKIEAPPFKTRPLFGKPTPPEFDWS